jgi:hypothetical protein
MGTVAAVFIVGPKYRPGYVRFITREEERGERSEK